MDAYDRWEREKENREDLVSAALLKLMSDTNTPGRPPLQSPSDSERQDPTSPQIGRETNRK